MNEPLIRPARPADALACARLLALTWRKSFSGFLSARAMSKVSRRWHRSRQLAVQMDARDMAFVVAEGGQGSIVGVATARKLSPKAAFLMRLYVRPGFHGRGVGGSLMGALRKAFPRVERMRLEVLSSNKQAIRFYRRRGFRFVGRKSEDLGGGDRLALSVMEGRFA